MAENRATFSLRRRFALGFSKRRLSRTVFSVPSRSIFFFNRRNALSTGSPFFNLISVKSIHFLSRKPGRNRLYGWFPTWVRAVKGIFAREKVNGQKSLNATESEGQIYSSKRIGEVVLRVQLQMGITCN
jgi:hypothetical protein